MSNLQMTPLELENYFLSLVNQERAAAGVKPLTFDGELLVSSNNHSVWMDQADTFSHTGANGSSAGDRMASAGYGWQSWGENIAYVSGDMNEATVRQLHTNLMNSQSHRENLLKDYHEEVGIGLHKGNIGGWDVIFVTQNFATPNATERAEPNDIGGPPALVPTPTNPTPANIVVGTGSDSLVLKVTQDYYLGDAQYAVFVDGKQIGGTLTAKSIHNSGSTDTVTVKGDWAAGQHSVQVKLLNDAWGGTASTDRNVYVESATYNQLSVSGSNLYIDNGDPKGFSFTDATSAPAPTPTPTPAPTPAPTPDPELDTITVKIAGSYFKGDPKFNIEVDDKLLGTRTVTADYGKDWQTFTFTGDFDRGGLQRHHIEIDLINDLYEEGVGDRNLYVDEITFNGVKQIQDVTIDNSWDKDWFFTL